MDRVYVMWICRKGAAVLIALALVVVLVVFVSKAADAKKIAEQLSLGEKYLSELKYEQAEAAYLEVIEIDPKNVDAYIGLADVYVAQGEYDKAIEVLQDALGELGEGASNASDEVKQKLDEVEGLRKEVEVTVTLVPIVPTAANVPTAEPVVTNTPVTTEMQMTERVCLATLEPIEWAIYTGKEKNMLTYKRSDITTVTEDIVEQINHKGRKEL